MKTEPTSPHDPHHDLLRAIRLCHPGWETLGPLTFAASRLSATQWQAELFQNILRPRIFAAQSAASTNDGKTLLALDAALEKELPEPCRAWSWRAGQALLANYTAPPAEKCWMRYAKAAAEAQTPGHLAIALAVRAATFHLAPRATLGAYVFLEAQGGLPKGGFPQWAKMVDECLTAGGDGFALRAA